LGPGGSAKPGAPRADHPQIPLPVPSKGGPALITGSGLLEAPLHQQTERTLVRGHSILGPQAHGGMAPETVFPTTPADEPGQEVIHRAGDAQLTRDFAGVFHRPDHRVGSEAPHVSPVGRWIFLVGRRQHLDACGRFSQAESAITDTCPADRLVPPRRANIVKISGAPVIQIVPEDEGVELVNQDELETRQGFVEPGRKQQFAVGLQRAEIAVGEP